MVRTMLRCAPLHSAPLFQSVRPVHVTGAFGRAGEQGWVFEVPWVPEFSTAGLSPRKTGSTDRSPLKSSGDAPDPQFPKKRKCYLWNHRRRGGPEMSLFFRLSVI